MLRTWQRNLVCAIAGADWCPRELHISGIGFKRSLDAVARAARTLPVPGPGPVPQAGSDSDTGSGPGDWHGHASALCQRVLGALGRPDLAESYLRVLAERRAAQVDGYRPMLVEAFASAAALPLALPVAGSASPAASAPTSASVTTTPAGSQAAAGVLYVDYCLSQRHCTWQWSAGSGSRVRLRLHLAAFCTVTQLPVHCDCRLRRL